MTNWPSRLKIGTHFSTPTSIANSTTSTSRSPRDFLAQLAFLLNGEQEAKLFVYMVAKILEREHGVLIDADRWLEAFERGDAGFVRDWLGRLDSLLR